MIANTNAANANTMPFEAVKAYLHSINMTTDTKRSVGRWLVDEAQREAADSEVVMDFAREMTDGMTGIDPEIKSVIEDNYWEML